MKVIRHEQFIDDDSSCSSTEEIYNKLKECQRDATSVTTDHSSTDGSIDEYRPLEMNREPQKSCLKKGNGDSFSTQETMSSTKSGGSIRFSDEEHQELATIIGYVPIHYEMHKRVKRSYWWRSKDIEGFRLGGKLQASEIRMCEGVTEPVDEGYSKAQCIGSTTEEPALEAILSLKEKKMYPAEIADNLERYMTGLKTWATNRQCGRGLEHWVSKKHHTARRETMDQSRKVISALSSRKESPEEIAKQYQDYSRPSRILARMVGEADEYAVAYAESDEKRIQDEYMLMMY